MMKSRSMDALPQLKPPNSPAMALRAGRGGGTAAGAFILNCMARQWNPTSLDTLTFHRFYSHPLHKPISFSCYQYQNGFKQQTRTMQAIHTDAVTPNKQREENEQKSPENWKIKMLYDGDCPLCMREVNMLRERNKLYGTIKFVDISSDEYSAEENQGLDYKTVMGRIHAILDDGTIVTDVEIRESAEKFKATVEKFKATAVQEQITKHYRK